MDNYDLTKREKFELQNNEYEFPYHYLPYIKNDKFFLGREISHGAGYMAYMMHYAEHINNLRPKSYLDIGCGDGRIFEFINPNISCSGCDLSERAIAFGKAFNPNVDIRCVDIADMPDEAYDCISLIEVIEHIPDDALSEFIRNAWSKLKMGGHCVISVPTVNLKPIPKKHYRHYTLELLEEELQQADVNYEIQKVEYILKYDKKYRLLLKLSNNHLIRFEFLKAKLWNHTKNNLISAQHDTGFHLFVDMIKN